MREEKSPRVVVGTPGGQEQGAHSNSPRWDGGRRSPQGGALRTADHFIDVFLILSTCFRPASVLLPSSLVRLAGLAKEAAARPMNPARGRSSPAIVMVVTPFRVLRGARRARREARRAPLDPAVCREPESGRGKQGVQPRFPPRVLPRRPRPSRLMNRPTSFARPASEYRCPRFQPSQNAVHEQPRLLPQLRHL